MTYSEDTSKNRTVINKEQQTRIVNHLTNCLLCQNQSYTPVYMQKRPCDKARLMEWSFLQGVTMALHAQGSEMPPAWQVCIMSGRSIFTL